VIPLRITTRRSSISRVKYPTLWLATLAIRRCDRIQDRPPWDRERQISSSGYQIPLRLAGSRGQSGAKQLSKSVQPG
jgi:hypothetical protein